jgi:hypothetical protein
MQQECPECARLWSEYVASRLSYADLRKQIDATRTAGKGAEELVIRAREVFERKENLRAALDEHKQAAHRGQ